MRKALPFIALVIFSFNAIAQSSNGTRVIDVDENTGRVFLASNAYYVFPPDKYVRVVEGSPYLTEYWMKSNYIHSGTRKHVLMRLDLLANEVHYLDETKRELIATTPIKQLLLVDTLFGVQYHFIHSSLLYSEHKFPEGWYQQLISGKASLYKFYSKQLSESLPYGQATVEQKIATVPYYYVLKDNELVRVKKVKDLEDILVDKNKQIAAFIKSKKFQGKEDEGYFETISLYNQLIK